MEYQAVFSSQISRQKCFYCTATQGLLQSDHLPPPLVEEAELREMVRHTLANDKGKAYHHLVEACLGQTMNLSQGRRRFNQRVTSWRW